MDKKSQFLDKYFLEVNLCGTKFIDMKEFYAQLNEYKNYSAKKKKQVKLFLYSAYYVDRYRFESVKNWKKIRITNKNTNQDTYFDLEKYLTPEESSSIRLKETDCNISINANGKELSVCYSPELNKINLHTIGEMLYDAYSLLDLILSDLEVKDDEVPPEQVAFFEMVRFRTDTIRIDFNPNHSMHSPAGQWLLKEVIAKIREKHFSRCDIAFDVYNFPQIQYYQVWKWGMTKKFFYGRDGQIQTVYFGARASERQIRLYNKKLEQEKRHGRIINIDSLWRLEMQLRGSKIDNYVDEVKDMLEHFYLPEWESEPTIQRQMIVYALINNLSFYGKASPRTKARYRDMIRECKGSNAISQEMARQFARDIKMLEGTLQEMLQRFHVRF
ncbi:replication initiation factor domain-containing protein [Lactobacillus amylovorus]|nr:replication initiation factor domain-containing protein [Lactobacillus amylovorus]